MSRIFHKKICSEKCQTGKKVWRELCGFSQDFSAEKSGFRIITSVPVVSFLNERLFAWKYVLVLIFKWKQRKKYFEIIEASGSVWFVIFFFSSLLAGY